MTPGSEPAAGRPLDVGRERDLVASAESGDAGAREELVDAFMPSIGAVARGYQRSSPIDRSDLMQEGVVGLLRAIPRYDAEMEMPFWAYASWWVRQAMQQLVSELSGPVVLSTARFAGSPGSRRRAASTTAVHGEEPTAGDLAAATALEPGQVESLLAVERPARGLDEPLGSEGGGTTVGDVVADPESEDEYARVMEAIEAAEARELVGGLDGREQTVLCSHYGLGRGTETLREIGNDLGLSIERVRQIEDKALTKLRDAVEVPSV